jgi:hypothetical protein
MARFLYVLEIACLICQVTFPIIVVRCQDSELLAHRFLGIASLITESTDVLPLSTRDKR